MIQGVTSRVSLGFRAWGGGGGGLESRIGGMLGDPRSKCPKKSINNHPENTCEGLGFRET